MDMIECLGCLEPVPENYFNYDDETCDDCYLAWQRRAEQARYALRMATAAHRDELHRNTPLFNVLREQDDREAIAEGDHHYFTY